MCAQPLVVSGLVLDRVASGEHWRRLAVFTAEHGLLDCLQRLARRSAATSPPLDLFDEARLGLESRNQGRTWFVREAVIERRRAALGASFPALRAACRFARVLVHNPLPDESRAAIHALLLRALAAWETGVRPDAVHFKTLFLFARDEGLPVREEWVRRLAAADRAAVDSILRHRPPEQVVTEPEVTRLAAALEAYLRETTDMRIDA